MNLAKTFLILLLFPLLFGCGTIHQWTAQATQIDMQNAEATRKLAKDLLATWKLNSGFIRGSLGPKIQEFPANTVRAMDELDALADKPNPTDYDLGYSLGVRVRMLSALVQEAMRLYAPEVLKYVPGVLGL